MTGKLFDHRIEIKMRCHLSTIYSPVVPSPDTGIKIVYELSYDNLFEIAKKVILVVQKDWLHFS